MLPLRLPRRSHSRPRRALPTAAPRRGRLRNQIQDQTQYAHLLLEMLASLEQRGATLAKSKTIKTRYERVANAHAVDSRTTLKASRTTSWNSTGSASSNGRTETAGRAAAGTTNTASISTPRSPSTAATRSKRNATGDTLPLRQTKRTLSLSGERVRIARVLPRSSPRQTKSHLIAAEAFSVLSGHPSVSLGTAGRPLVHVSLSTTSTSWAIRWSNTFR